VRDTMMQAALLSGERTWADSVVVRGKARQLARVRQWLAGVEEPLRVTDTHDYVPLATSLPAPVRVPVLWPGCDRTGNTRDTPPRTTNSSGEEGV